MWIKATLRYLPIKYKETFLKKSLNPGIMIKQAHTYTIREVIKWEDVLEIYEYVVGVMKAVIFHSRHGSTEAKTYRHTYVTV